MDEDLETHHEKKEEMVGALLSLADGTPALGIVAAVLGVIKTMGSISEPPEVLGHMIGGALVGRAPRPYFTTTAGLGQNHEHVSVS